MPIRHKFYQEDFRCGFETHNAILDITPYKPEVMIIGTFNPCTQNANFADFFYGRNYLWPAFKNLFNYNDLVLSDRRMHQRGAPPAILDPTLPEIFKLCSKLKLTFSDLILEVLHKNSPKIQSLKNDNVIFNGQEYNLIQDGKNNNASGLEQLDAIGQVNWNTDRIIDYLCKNPQITLIYFTRQPKGVWKREWDRIVQHKCSQGRQLTNIYSPSGRRIPKPVMKNLINKWIIGDIGDIPKYKNIDNNWLIQKGVDITMF